MSILVHSSRVMLGFSLGILASFALVAGVLALTNGTQNGRDTAGDPWYGDDNPDDLQGSYAYNNSPHDLILNEWNEPGNDWIRNLDMDWSYDAAVKLNNETGTHALDYEIRIHDQYYYNFVNSWQTNLPISKAPENENWFEELNQGYTEVDMEQDDPYRIDNTGLYYWNQYFDSEKSAVSGAPQFYSEIEYCNKSYTGCNFDVTGKMHKKVLMK
jgi:hypothetical protein